MFIFTISRFANNFNFPIALSTACCNEIKIWATMICLVNARRGQMQDVHTLILPLTKHSMAWCVRIILWYSYSIAIKDDINEALKSSSANKVERIVYQKFNRIKKIECILQCKFYSETGNLYCMISRSVTISRHIFSWTAVQFPNCNMQQEKHILFRKWYCNSNTLYHIWDNL